VTNLSRVLNVGSALLFIEAAISVISGIVNFVLALFEGEAFGITVSQASAFNPLLMDKMALLHRLEGLYLLGLSFALCLFSLYYFRRREK
jgi:hypothetical protein